MTISYNLAPNGRWSARIATGFAAVGGSVFTYQDRTRIPKATFQDPAGLILNTNPIILDSAGEATIYWANDQFYTIEVFDANGFLIYSEDNYPVIGGTGGGGDIIINETFENIVLNNQFLRWGNNDFNKDATSTTVYTRLGTNELVADLWGFKRNNTNCTVVISQKQFNVGQSQVPGNPINYLNYECTNVGAGAETFKNIYQSYPSSQLFSNTEISFSIWAMSSNNDPLIISIEQFFGTGGSPSATVTTQILTTTLTSIWTQYTGQITVPSVAGKVVGNNGDDSFNLCINVPLNAIANSSFAAVQLNEGNELVSLATTTVLDQLSRNTQITLTQSQTGDCIFSIGSGDRPGWLLCNDTTIGSSFSGSNYTGNHCLPLFLLLWTLNPTFLPIFDSSGNPTTRGVSAIADFNADKRLSLTKTLG
ncbi:MAG TPA: hypothetical protein VKR58_15100, partial [Aquella sp.]|nr:hypothetical protein [Aquella sp.]